MNDRVQVVINIPQETYEYWKENKAEYVLAEAIADGTVLPKHGRLVDAQEIVKLYSFNKNTNALNGDDDAFLIAIRKAKTILEASEVRE